MLTRNKKKTKKNAHATRHSHSHTHARTHLFFLESDSRLVGVSHPIEQADASRLHLLLDVGPVGSDQGDAREEHGVHGKIAGRVDPGVARQSFREAPLG